ncbi:tRNA(Ile)-lysidine synthetase, partial [Burkholderia sp. TJI49]
RMRTSPGGPGRTLKNLFQERGVPAWQRDVPLLFAGEHLIYVPRLGVNRDGGLFDGGPSAHEGWRRIEWRPDMLLAGRDRGRETCAWRSDGAPIFTIW